MEKVWNNGLTVPNMKEHMKMERNMAKAHCIFKMAVGIKGNLLKIIFKDMACYCWPINENILGNWIMTIHIRRSIRLMHFKNIRILIFSLCIQIKVKINNIRKSGRSWIFIPIQFSKIYFLASSWFFCCGLHWFSFVVINRSCWI